MTVPLSPQTVVAIFSLNMAVLDTDGCIIIKSLLAAFQKMPEDFRHTYIPVLIKHFTDKRLFYLLSKKGLNKVQDAVNHLTSLIDLGGVILVDE